MTRYIISPETSQDLEAISNYFLTHNVDAGERLLREFDKKCKNLVNFPNLGRSYESLRPGIRGLPLMAILFFTRWLERELEFYG